jgi:glycosyltransferase involved in cell wall biosynthesis
LINKTLVSVIVSCYNQAAFIDECLDSVLKQSFINWECIIVNDGSLDNIDDVVKKWLSQDIRFIYITKKNGGVSSARNEGISRATGEFILPLDADDMISENFLQEAYTSICSNPEISLVKSTVVEFGDRCGTWSSDYAFQKLLFQNIICCTALFRKKDWEMIGHYDTAMWGYEDWEFWINLLKRGGKVITLNTITFYYRIKKVSLNQELKRNKIECNRLRAYISFKHADLYKYDAIEANNLLASRLLKFVLLIRNMFR